MPLARRLRAHGLSLENLADANREAVQISSACIRAIAALLREASEAVAPEHPRPGPEPWSHVEIGGRRIPPEPAAPQPGEVWEDSEDGEQVRIDPAPEIYRDGSTTCTLVRPKNGGADTWRPGETVHRRIEPPRWRRVSVPWSAEVPAKLAPDGAVRIDAATFEREVRAGIARAVGGEAATSPAGSSPTALDLARILEGATAEQSPPVEVLHAAARELRRSWNEIGDLLVRVGDREAERDHARDAALDIARQLQSARAEREADVARWAAWFDAMPAELRIRRDGEPDEAEVPCSGAPCAACGGTRGRTFVSDARPWKRRCEACGARNLVPEWGRMRRVTGRGARRHRARRRSANAWIGLDLLAGRALPRHALREVRAWVARGEVG